MEDAISSSFKTERKHHNLSDSDKLHKVKKQKKKQKSKKKHKKEEKLRHEHKDKDSSEDETLVGPSVPTDFILSEPSRSMCPMTKEEWEAKKSIIRHIVDPETGRKRLVRGDGEILEEIVSRDRHKEINKLATQADGAFFQKTLFHNK
ncbi:ADP-ribosylation factor-like protein 6-interacting protein 4 isoform X2 [Artemia franciscana]|uniref:ADP-ribosylation factor-like protein 6-interacting protein 4 n=2 Tax=Artemia franciscana TaxID=6661 RepID=A0AA88HRV4_ARTSF|nr:hypothetical protein QYM36_012021 [Artemia franciscana]KAK2710702.1 hypothetical protein QYM36_012021 [Artemia franciscana]KAK2710703.1 hypothetical protein QYM36_012021 [Artemia franciscana]KAK2710704.1 hypothetical protein QYM36_012021 [Artemia franciscana]